MLYLYFLLLCINHGISKQIMELLLELTAGVSMNIDSEHD
jgi:hypothetical protein